jgi:SlyX protein
MAMRGNGDPVDSTCDTGKTGYPRTMTDITSLEERIAHLTRAVEDLSDEVARQDKEIAVMKRRLGVLMEREAEREVAESGTIPLADQKPPHW